MIEEQIENIMNGNLPNEMEIKVICEKVKIQNRLKKSYPVKVMYNQCPYPLLSVETSTANFMT